MGKDLLEKQCCQKFVARQESKWYHQKKQRRLIFIVYEKMLKQKKQLTKEIQELEEKISHLPEGKLVITSHKKYTKWYVSDGHNLIYIPKKEKAYAKQLALKKYYMLRRENKKQELYAIEQCLKAHDNSRESEQEFLNSMKIKELLPMKNPNLSEKLNDWMAESYIKCDYHPERLTCKTSSGIKVRSKSEALIESILTKYNIPFRYECQLIVGDKIFYPDFTIMHPKTSEIFYWEHHGMMDDPGYCKQALNKLQQYIAGGLVPGMQLITTYETQTQPINVEVIERVVREVFL